MCSLLVVYHFFPHYRRGFIAEILKKWPNAEFVGSIPDRRSHHGVEPYVPDSGFRIIKLQNLPLRKYYLRGFLKYFLRSKSPHVIFLGDMNCLSTWIYGIFYRLRGRRVYFWAHGWLNSRERKVTALMRNLFFRIPNTILVYGRRSRKLAVDRGFNPSNIHVIYNSLDYLNQLKLRTEIEANNAEVSEFISHLGVTGDRKYLICVARLTKLKKFEQAIQACSMIEISNRPLLVFIGEGPVEVELRTLATNLGVAVHFVGACYDERTLAKYIMNAAGVISPGNVGLTAMHSLAYGVPVITHGDDDAQMPEAEAIIDGVTGFRFTMNSVPSLSSSIVTLLSMTEEDRLRMRGYCIKIIEVFFNPRHQLRKLENAVKGNPEQEPISIRITKKEITENDSYYVS